MLLIFSNLFIWHFPLFSGRLSEFVRSLSSFAMENSSRATTTFQLVRGKHGRCLVYFGGYVYHKNKSCSNIHSRMYWKCSKSQALGCRARAQTLGNVIRTTGPGHNHPPSGGGVIWCTLWKKKSTYPLKSIYMDM